MEEPSLKERIDEKISDIDKFLTTLAKALPPTLEQYEKDEIKKAACERLAEKIIQAVVDLAFLIIRYCSLIYEKDDDEVFPFLEKEGIINEALAKKLKEAKGMRNFLAHEYGKINDEIVFSTLQNELEHDAQEFIACVEKQLERERKQKEVKA